MGAVAGALMGYTAGPAIAHSLGGWAFDIAIQRPACNTSQRPNPGSCCQGKATAGCRIVPPVAKTREIVASKTARPVQELD